MKKKICSIILVLIFIFSNVLVSNAANQPFDIYPDTKAAIEQCISVDSANESYFNGVEQQFYKNIHTTSDDLNEMLMDAVIQIRNLDIIASEELNQAILEQENLRSANHKQRTAPTNYQSLLSHYALGIDIVRAAGCPNTAASMEHAVVPEDKVGTLYTPSRMTYTNNSWAKTLCLNESLFWDIEAKFQREILQYNKSYGTVSGTFTFTRENSSLDAKVQLHAVNYTATFSKKSNGYSCTTKLIDTFDFEWNKYNDIAVDFGNNYCYVMQRAGYIKPYGITITYSY